MSGSEFYVKVVVDMDADAAYIELADTVEAGEASVNEDFALRQRQSMVVFDMNERGELLGIEIVGISGLFKKSNSES